MNLRTAILFFWGLLMAMATLEGNCKEVDQHGIEPDRAAQVDASHEANIRKEIAKTTN